jgi:hypothetical protein
VLIEWIMKSQELPGLRENAFHQHEKILESILNRNPVKARENMVEHLATFQRAYTLLGRIVHAQAPGVGLEKDSREAGSSRQDSKELTV